MGSANVDPRPSQRGLDRPPESGIQLASADRKDTDLAEGPVALAAITENEDLRLVGEDRDQPLVKLGHGGRHDDETPGLGLHSVTIPESDR